MIKRATSWLAIGCSVAIAQLTLSLPTTAVEQSECFTDWGAAGEIVRRERLVTVEALAARAQLKLGGVIIKATLCRDPGGFVYRLVVRGHAGQLRSTVVGASSGIERSPQP